MTDKRMKIIDRQIMKQKCMIERLTVKQTKKVTDKIHVAERESHRKRE